MAKRKSKIRCLLITDSLKFSFFDPIFFDLRTNLKLEIRLELQNHTDSNITTPSSRRDIGSTGSILNNDLIFIDLENISSFTFFQIGIARSIGKPIIFLLQNNALISHNFPDFITDGYFIFYKNKIDFSSQIEAFIEEFIESPKRFSPRPIIDSDITPQINIDLEKLDSRQFENLCFELLSKLGYKQVEWIMKDEFIDAVSILPKKDPDGFEYEEYWLISFSNKEYENTKMLEIALNDPEYFVERIFRTFNSRNINHVKFQSRTDTPITILFILQNEGRLQKKIKELALKDHKVRTRGLPHTLRIRWWNEQLITSLVHDNIQLAKKYFSSQALTSSNIRLSYEDLYKENLIMYEQVAKTNEALISEKSRIELLERDAAWKLLSFTAAHRLGNPIDAIDSELQNLKSALKINKQDIAEEAMQSMESSIEKAKSIVSQFRNLSIAHEIKPVVISSEKIKDTLKQSAKQAADKDINVKFDLIDIPDIYADLPKLSECFDEIIKNALHFVKGNHKKIHITLSIVQKKDLPDKIAKSNNYIKITFEDNGCGIPFEKKAEIFKPFERGYVHGTGLGLAFCEAIIEKHGGKIQETGKPNEGACFEIFLPTYKSKILQTK